MKQQDESRRQFVTVASFAYALSILFEMCALACVFQKRQLTTTRLSNQAWNWRSLSLFAFARILSDFVRKMRFASTLLSRSLPTDVWFGASTWIPFIRPRSVTKRGSMGSSDPRSRLPIPSCQPAWLATAQHFQSRARGPIFDPFVVWSRPQQNPNRAEQRLCISTPPPPPYTTAAPQRIRPLLLCFPISSSCLL